MSSAAASQLAVPQPVEAWPTLPLSDWKATRDTLHMWTQVIGKIRLALCPSEPQWGHVPLYVTARGLTTSSIPCLVGAFEIDFDFIDHVLTIGNSEGATRTIDLVPRTVAAFYGEVVQALRSLGIEVDISTKPSEVPNPIRFPEDDTHASYDPEAVTRFFRVLVRVDAVLKEHRARFRGRVSRVQFFWGSFDLAYSRFSGRPADPPPGGDIILRLAMDAEEVAFGFWPGDDRFPEPAFYSYTYPKPAGIERAAIGPRGAFWSDALGEFVLRYEDVRRAPSPREALLEFLDTCYVAGATLGGWDRAAVE